MELLIHFSVLACMAAMAGYFGLLIGREYRRFQLTNRIAGLEKDRLCAEIILLSDQLRYVDKKGEHLWDGFRKFMVSAKKMECDDVCSFYFAPHDNKPLPPYQPGQYLTFQLNIQGQTRPVVRCYSLSDSPDHPDYYRVTIKRVPAPPDKPGVPPGLVSNFFHDELKEGDIVDVKAPSGNFYLDMTRRNPVVLIAGGVGLTPILSMLNSTTKASLQREIWFFYGIRDRAEMIQRKHLERVAAADPNVKLHFCMSKPAPGDLKGPNHHGERVSVELFKKVLPSNNFDFYICGPPPLMSGVTKGLLEWGVPEKSIHFEAFGPATVKKATPVPTEAEKAANFQVTFSRSNKTCAWSAKSGSLLDFAAANQVNIDFGCRAGNCGTCITAVKSGEIRYLNEPGAPPEKGSCLACIAVPKGDLVLDA